MKKVMILGSCVSRDAIAIADKLEFELVGYFARSSLASLATEPSEDKAALDAIESNFQRRMVAADFTKTVLTAIQDGNFDIFLVDFIDERFNVLELSENKVVTISKEYKKAKAGKYKGKVLSWNSVEKFNYWKAGFDKIIEVLKCSAQLHKLKVLKLYWSEQDNNGAKLDEYSEEMLRQNNLYLDELYNYVRAKLGGGVLVDFAPELFKADVEHKWGVQPFHYIPLLYRKILTSIDAVNFNRENCTIRALSEINRVAKNYINILKNTSRAVYGSQLMSENILTLPHFSACDISQNFSWEMDPFENRTWQWQLNWFAFIPDVIVYDSLSPSEDNILKVISFIKSWTHHYIDDSSNKFEFAWHDHGSAMRAEQVLLFLHHVVQKHPDFFGRYNELLSFLNYFLYEHAVFLSLDKFYSEHTNHGLEQARVLLMLSIVFEGGVFAANWKAKAIERLNSELNFSFTEEGVHVENSPAYHYFVLKTFLQIVEDYAQYDLGMLKSNFDALARKALEFLTFIIHPDGFLPIIGDTEAVNIADVFSEYFAGDDIYKNFLFCRTKGKLGTPPLRNFSIYPHSGYGIIRSGWSKVGQYSNDSHLVCKAGNISQYHNQQDDGSLVFYGRGEHWLVDSGMFNHNRHTPTRKYMRSRQAHNVVHVTTSTYATKWDDVRHSWRVDASEQGAVRMYSTVYQGVELCRSIKWIDGLDGFEVTDEITVLDGRSHDVDVLWHLDSNKLLELDSENNFMVKSALTGQVLSMDIIDEQRFETVCWTGESIAHGLSVISRKKNQLEDTTTIKIKLREVQGYRKVVFLFKFLE